MKRLTWNEVVLALLLGLVLGQLAGLWWRAAQIALADKEDTETTVVLGR